MSEDKTSETPTNTDVAAENPTAKLQADLDKAKSDYLYLLAEFDNYRKNSVRERSELTKFGSERFIREFLTIFDDFERALDADVQPENFASFRDGVKMIATELKGLLTRFSVEEIPAEGLPFDPLKHEALSSEPRTDMPAGSVARVFKKAYKMHDKIIRPAQVTVSTENA